MRLFINLLKVFAAALLIAVGSLCTMAQSVDVKTNIVSDALQDINLGAELVVSPRWSVDLTGDFNGWTRSNGTRWKHWLLQPEARYWLCDPLSGHFFGFHLLGGQYNIGGLDLPFKMLGTDFSKLKDYRFQGWFGGAGIAYGYAWALNPRWNIEAEIGIGWTYTRYDQFRCTNCGKKVATNKPHNYYGITKSAINLVYIF